MVLFISQIHLTLSRPINSLIEKQDSGGRENSQQNPERLALFVGNNSGPLQKASALCSRPAQPSPFLGKKLDFCLKEQAGTIHSKSLSDCPSLVDNFNWLCSYMPSSQPRCMETLRITNLQNVLNSSARFLQTQACGFLNGVLSSCGLPLSLLPSIFPSIILQRILTSHDLPKWDNLIVILLASYIMM